MLEFLKDFLTHEDPNVRAKACSALGNMCRHSSYFYSSLVSNEPFVSFQYAKPCNIFLKFCGHSTN